MMIPPMYDALYVLHNLVFSCMMIGILYSIYYLNSNVFLYTLVISITAFSVLYLISKKRPIKRRHSDYHEDEPVFDSNA